MTQGEIQREFAAGRLTAREAADASIAIRPRASRALRVVAVLLLYTFALAGVAVLAHWRVR